MLLLAIAGFSPGFVACAGAKIVNVEGHIEHEVSRIATSPFGDTLADEIAVDVRESDQNTAEILNTSSTLSLIERLGIMAIKATSPENLERLRSEGIDAWLETEYTNHPTSDTPQTVKVRISSTHDLEQFIRFTWHNAWGGVRGSIADWAMRKGRESAAEDIADEIVRRLYPEP
jgi:hypothetical protein